MPSSTAPPYPRPQKNRAPITLRPLSAELSSLSRSDGSASLVAGNTHVLCAVHGPMAPRVSRWEKYDTGVVSVAFSRGLMATSAGGGSSGSTVDDAGENVVSATTTTNNRMKSVPVPPPPGLGATERELEYFLRDALSSCILLDKYPRCVIQVVVQVVQANGSVLGSAVNCAVMALMDAGVAMRGLPVASTCCVVANNYFNAGLQSNTDGGDDNGAVTIWLDPTAEEEAGEGHAIVVLVMDKATSSTSSQDTNDEVSVNYDGGEIVTSFTFGAPLPLKGLLSSVASTKQAGAAMVAFMRLAIEQKVQNEVQTLWS